ncbi:hypothetical protein [uncultured Jannaschia sp.]|uniref:hypothetical protein n=1 Tax=uncultured Jannaschia sp. TaxID=293347 RepID=UPI00263016E4|nr:hypothetical protein [uncultured Jannaschia sp.]
MDQKDRQIASLCGQLEIVETLLVHLLKKEARAGSFEADTLQQIFNVMQRQDTPENEFDEEWQKSRANMATRLRAHLKISEVVRTSIKESSAGEA